MWLTSTLDRYFIGFLSSYYFFFAGYDVDEYWSIMVSGRWEVMVSNEMSCGEMDG